MLGITNMLMDIDSTDDIWQMRHEPQNTSFATTVTHEQYYMNRHHMRQDITMLLTILFQKKRKHLKPTESSIKMTDFMRYQSKCYSE